MIVNCLSLPVVLETSHSSVKTKPSYLSKIGEDHSEITEICMEQTPFIASALLKTKENPHIQSLPEFRIFEGFLD